MSTALTALLLLLAAARQDVDALLEQLAADALEQREAAERALLAIGAPAGPALRRALQAAEGESALRLRFLVRVLEFRESLPPALRAAIPDVELRLARDRWSDVLLEAGDRRRHPALRREDLEPLAAPAFREPLSAEKREALCRMAGWRRLSGAVPALAAMSADAVAADLAGEALLAIGGPEAVAAYAEGSARLEDFEFSVRLWNLPGLDRPAVLKGLSRALAAPEDRVRFRAAELLARLGSAEGAAELLRGWKGEDPERRRDAALALARLGRRDGLPLFLELLGNAGAEASEKNLALEALAGLRATEAIPALERLLEAEDFWLRDQAALALGRMGAPGAVERLGRLLDAAEGQLRRAAMRALAAMNTPAAVPFLARRLDDPDVFVRGAALRALARLEGARRLPDILAFMGRPTVNDSLDAAFALEEIPREAWIPKLREMAREGKHLSKLSTALWCMEEPAPAADLLPHFESASIAEKDGLAEYFAVVRFREAVPALEAWLPRCDGFRRASVAGYLCLLGSKAGIPDVLRRLDEGGNWSAIALNAIRSPEACRELHRIRIELPEPVAPADAWARVAAKLGVALEEPETLSWEEAWAFRLPRAELSDRHVWETLDSLAAHTPFETVVEPGRLRVLRREEALAFWKAWAAR